MIRNYLKIAWRNLMKYRFISFINLFGLTVGLTCCLLITTYVLNELSYDRYNSNADNIYRVTRTFNNDQGVVSLTLSTVSPPFGYYFPTDFPEIKKMTRLLDNGITPLRYKEKLINEQHVYFADENLFDVFTVKVVQGNPKTALSDPFSVMLSEDNAKKYFGAEDPMNKTLRYNNQFDLKVTGVYKSFPANAHIHPEMMVSFSTLNDSLVYGAENMRTNWGNNSFFTYLLLPEHYDIKNMESRFPAFIDSRMAGQEYVGKQASKFTKLGLQKLTDIHLYSHTDYEAEPNGDIGRVYIFAAIALFILLIACINCMNLSTARSALRAKEIGIRKVIGAERKELIFQFLGESVIITVIAGLLSVACLWLTLPWLNKVSGQQLSMNILLQWQVLVPVLLAPVAVGLISGIYPALFMSSFRPIQTLKGLFKVGGSTVSFRKVLVVTQFSISIILIITTVVVFQQLDYMQQKSLGFDKEQIAVVPYNAALNDKFEAFRNELLSNSNIKDASRSSRIPTGRLLDAQDAYTTSGDSLQQSSTDIKLVAVDYDFIPAYGIKMAAGRNFSRAYGTDTAGFIINETAVKALGWKSPQDAVGREFKYGNIPGRIIGVTKDFHFENLHQAIVPLVFEMFPQRISFFNNLSVKFSGNGTTAALEHLEATWKKFLPEIPFEYNFLDDNFNKLYQSEQRQGSIFTSFACIAIFIACLGLFGLSAFTISQRVKEIGVRKVLGANTTTIVALLSKDFLWLVSIAALIAFPVAWYSMDSWLKDFAYRINMQWWVFLLAAIAALLVALLTVGYQAIKAALANPVKSLRTE
ncbi:MAG TPA: ABC transporter permease [Panacibacter sp.]|nr:ABC transporter permease [Panacibacter sp.]HNP45952.1 ABC transporter permease [Panacibacter sp.]